MKLDVVLGLQWGDEGKGKIVDVLANNYPVVARFQGGPQCRPFNSFRREKIRASHYSIRSFQRRFCKLYRQWRGYRSNNIQRGVSRNRSDGSSGKRESRNCRQGSSYFAYTQNYRCRFGGRKGQGEDRFHTERHRAYLYG